MKGGSSHGETGGRSEVVRQARTVRVTEAEAMVLLDNADQYMELALDDLASSNWDGVADNAVQCIVSANDALLGLRHSLRPSSVNHMDSATLLAEKEGTEEARINAACFLKIISKKNLVQSEGRSISETEARSLIAGATQFFEWAEGQINPDV